MFVNKFITHKINRAVKKNRPERASPSYSKIEQIGVIYMTEGPEKHQIIKSFVRELENSGKKVEVLSYLPAGKHNHEFLYDIFTPDEISFWGSFKSASVNKFIGHKYDYIINLDLKPTILIEHILAKCQAKCRVGAYHNSNSRLFEMMINLDKDDSIDNLSKQILHYIKQL